MSLGIPVKVGMPLEVMALMKLYPQPIQQSGVEYLPIDIPRQRRVCRLIARSKARPRCLKPPPLKKYNSVHSSRRRRWSGSSTAGSPDASTREMIAFRKGLNETG
jgi:hypothetical protein